MNTLKTIVLTLALALAAVPAAPGDPASTLDTPDVTSLPAVQGAGLWAQLRCSACIGAAVGLSISGWRGVLYLLSDSGDVAGACVSACAGTA